MSEVILFPKWKYSQTEDDRVVNSADEEAALKGEWYDTPADFPAPKGKK